MQIQQHQHQQSHEQEDPNNQQDESQCDQLALQTLKHQVSLTNYQLLELTYNDQKFYQTLYQLNHYGCQHINKMQFTQALVYLTEAEKVLEYAASCGKAIEKKLIIAILNNEASLYQKAWQLEKAESYLQAIIYNISSSFQSYSEEQIPVPASTKLYEFTSNILDQNSTEYQDYSIALWRKKSLVIFYLQYCAINSQNKNNQRAFASAQKALTLIKQLCLDLYRYEKYVSENQQKKQQQYEMQQHHYTSQNRSILYQLGSFEQIEMKKVNIEVFYKTAVSYIAKYIKRLQSNTQPLSEEGMEMYKQCFENYSIGTIMQINPSQLDQQTDRLDLTEEITIIQKHFKAIYLSVGHFILGTQTRFIASEKYNLDENERRRSPQFLQSQIYHLCSIIILTKFLFCESAYFDHIVNSFRNHYKVDIMEDARKYFQIKSEFEQKQRDEEQQKYIQLFAKEEKAQKIIQQSHQHNYETEKIYEIEKIQSEVQIAYLTPGKINDNNPKKELYFNAQESLQFDQHTKEGKVKYFNQIKNKTIKFSKNHQSNQMSQIQQKHHKPKQQHTAIKKPQHKKTINPITKNSSHILTHQNSKSVFITTQQSKQPLKSTQLLTSREKENRLKPTQLNSNTKVHRSKRKSDYQFLSNYKKMYVSKEKIPDNIKDRTQSKRETIYSKRQSGYTPKKISRSKSTKRLPTSNEDGKKGLRRKDSYKDLKKTKKIQQQYGTTNQGTNKHLDGNKIQIKTSRSNISTNTNVKKSKNQKQHTQKVLKLSSPDLKFKKLKSPRNIKSYQS